jgi:hypothetical protein
LKNKILVWVDPNFIQLGITKFLHKKYDADYFAVTDLNHHLQKSFMKQEIVNFKKIWHYWDQSFKTQKINLEYLKNFETKYNMSLWMLVYSERIFLNYNEYYQFSSHEILQIIQHDCQLFEKILDEVNPNFLLINGVDFHRNYLLSKICKSRGIKVLMLSTSRFGYRCMISSEYDKFDENLKIHAENIPQKNLNELYDYMKQHDKLGHSMNIQTGDGGYSFLYKIKILFHWMHKTFDQKYRDTYDHYGITRYKVIKNQLFLIIKNYFRKSFLLKNSIFSIPDEKFVFFPLQVEPERNVLFGAPLYSNQLDIIEKIAKSLPVDYKLYVKEHPAMKKKHWRKISYYKKILDLPNVKLIHPSVKSSEIMRKSSLILTLNGTSGFEASFYGKPSIVFSDVIFSNLSWVHRIRNLEDLPISILNTIEKKVDVTELNNFINKLITNTFPFDEFKIYAEIFNKIHNGFIIGDDISMIELNNYFEENKILFEQLVNEHLEKIEKFNF